MHEKTPHRFYSIVLQLASLLALVSVQAVLANDGAPRCTPPDILAERLLGGATDWDLPLETAYLIDEAALEDGRLVAQLETTLGSEAFDRLRSLRTVLCVALVLDAEGELPVAHSQRVPLRLDGAEGWRYGFDVELPETASQLMMIVEEPASRRWGLAIAEDLGILDGPGAAAVQLGDAWHEMLGGAERRPTVAQTILRIIPPRQAEVGGTTRFDALVTTDAVDRVVFLLDGERVGEEKRRPFSLRVPLDNPPRPQVLEVIAYDEADREMGRDRLEINRLDRPFRARIEGLDGDPSTGSVVLRGRVDVPAEASLDRVEVYYGERLVGRFTDQTVRIEVDTPDVGPSDYLRLAAFLADGSSIDDVVLIQSPTLTEEVEVNLVELFTVVSDADGRPIDDLEAEDFTIVYDGRNQPTASFAFADDVSLLVGLVVDTSGSMQLVMHDTKKAAAKFLGTTVLPQDRSFLVDFDDRPRLLHPVTDDLTEVFLKLGRLEAEGATAMYDAIVFSMLQFERHRGRKALVVLSDGDDYESNFGPKYIVDLAQREGVPVYIIGLGALDTLRRTYSKKELRRITDDTGGRLYFVDSLEELDGAYAQIQAELRSQYSLSFYAERDLSDAERRKVRLKIDRSGAEPRIVIGARQAQ